MSVACDVETRPSAVMGRFERYLTILVALCIVAGIALGYLFPGLFLQVGRMEMANVNMPVAFLIWLMIIPMLLKVDFTALGQLRNHWRGKGVTLFVNWAVKSFSMALLAWVFIIRLRVEGLIHRLSDKLGQENND